MIGRTVSHYRITEKLGHGGMGEVYLAEDTSLERKVALKFLPPSLQEDDIARKRFLREAKSAAALEHPYICNIKEVSQTADRQDFIVMEYVEGQTLKEKLADGPLGMKEALQVGTEIAEALEVAHHQEMVHRDLKPANIMLTPQGHAKVMDFGLAKKVVREDGTEQDITSALTREGSTVGTLAYMSPEQVKAKPVDQRSDIFAFGIVLYEMLTGVHPFRKAQLTETTGAILHQEPVRLARYTEDVPELLQHTLNKMLAKNPDDRYQTVHEVRTNLRELSGEVSRSSEDAIPARRKPSRLPLALGLVGLLPVLLLVYWGWSVFRPSSPADEQDRRSIAVLPLDNLSAEADSDYFSDGLTEDIIAQLSKIGDLKVISRTSVMLYKGKDKSLRQIGEELGVATILEGSVRRADDRVRVVTQLIDADSDEHLWAETYDRQLDDIFAIQSDIAERIAEALQAELTPAEKNQIERKPTENLEAYNLYIQGRHLRRVETAQSLRTAVEHLERAIELDPGFAEAYALLAQCYFLGASEAPDRYVKAEAAVNRALDLNPGLPEAYSSLGSIRLWRDADWVAADRAYKKAAELGSNDPNVRGQYGLHLFRMGRLEAALRELQRAGELDPLWQSNLGHLVSTYIRTGAFDRAMEVAQRMLELDPSRAGAHRHKGEIYLSLSEYEKAETAFRKALEPPETYFIAGRLLGVTYLSQGRMQEAKAFAQSSLASRPTGGESLALVGQVASWAGEYSQARTYFQEALQSTYVKTDTWWRVGETPRETYLGHALWKLGDRAAAEEWLSERLRRDHQWLQEGDESYLSPLGIAYVRSVRGDKEEALRWLQQAIDKGWVQYDHAQKIPLFENLHQEPRFQEMMAEVKVKVDGIRRRIQEMEKEWESR